MQVPSFFVLFVAGALSASLFGRKIDNSFLKKRISICSDPATVNMLYKNPNMTVNSTLLRPSCDSAPLADTPEEPAPMVMTGLSTTINNVGAPQVENGQKSDVELGKAGGGGGAMVESGVGASPGGGGGGAGGGAGAELSTGGGAEAGGGTPPGGGTGDVAPPASGGGGGGGT